MLRAAGDRRDERDVGQVRAAGVGVVEGEDVAWLRAVVDDRGDRLRHRAEVHRDVLRLRDHPAVGVEEGARAVAALLDVRRAAALDEHHAHLLRDADEGAHEDRQRHRVGGVRTAHAPLQHECAGPVERRRPAGPDDAGRLRKLDHGGAVEPVARLESRRSRRPGSRASRRRSTRAASRPSGLASAGGAARVGFSTAVVPATRIATSSTGVSASS